MACILLSAKYVSKDDLFLLLPELAEEAGKEAA
jgi:hypothetical protein